MMENTHFIERMTFFTLFFFSGKSAAEREEYESVEKSGATTV